jgi:hypothetical protein
MPKFGLETGFVFLLLVLGLGISIVSRGYGFGTLQQPGPGLYPFLIGVAIAVLSLFVLTAQLKSEATTLPLDKEGAKTLVFMSLTFCLWIVAMPLLGYVVVTLLAAYAFCKIMKLVGAAETVCRVHWDGAVKNGNDCPQKDHVCA